MTVIRKKDAIFDYFFVLPALSLFALFTFYPFLKVIQLSFYEWNGIDPQMTFVGLSHYHNILFRTTEFWKAYGNATLITVLALVVQNSFALLLAVMVDRGIRGGQLYRLIFFLPPVLSFIVVGFVWRWIFDGYGILNHLLGVIGLTKYSDAHWAWLGQRETSLLCVAIVHMWKGFGYGFVILLAGLQAIPKEQYEAAQVDGASVWDQFRHITVPLMVPVFAVVSILTILGTMQIFDLIWSMTRGGPAGHTEVPVSLIYRYMTDQDIRKFGYSTAMAMVFGASLFLVSMAQIYLSKKLRYD